MRLIDTDEIKYTDMLFSTGNGNYEHVGMVTQYEIDALPTVDAVPLEWIKRRIEGLNIQAENSTDDNKWAEFVREAFALEKIVKFWEER